MRTTKIYTHVMLCCERLELLVLLVISVLGQSIFARFEIETPAWRQVLKWSIVIAATLGLYLVVGHWSLILPLVTAGGGTTFHLPRRPIRRIPYRR